MNKKILQWIKEGKCTIVPPEQVHESFQRINNEMKKVHREFKKKSKLSEIRASKIVLNA